MQFKDIINQNRIKHNLIELFNSGKMPHAVLFLGKEGVGGLPLSIAFAQYVFCENKTKEDSCGQCSACRKVAKLVHPDLHLSFPTIGGKPNLSQNYLPQFRTFFDQSPYENNYNWLQSIQAGNKQGNIAADECREIINRLNLTAFEGGYKIQIIWLPEYLGKEGNILLKLLEEPPNKTFLILVAEEEEAILNTILSRTQKIMLSPLSPVAISERLCEKLGAEPARALQIAQAAGNNYAKAVSLYHNSGHNDWMPVLKEWFNAIFTNNAIIMTKWVDEMGKAGREQQKHFLLFAQQILAEALRLSLAPNYKPALIAEGLSFAEKLAQKNLSSSFFEKMILAIEKTVYHIERNAHGKTQLLHLSLQIQYFIKGVTLEAFPS